MILLEVYYRFILQGKLEFSVRSSGYVVRKLGYEDMLNDDDQIITKEEIKRFEGLIKARKIPDNMKISHMWQLFKHYEANTWWTDLLKYGAIALGILMVVLLIFLGINHFCPRALGKQVGFQPPPQASGAGGGGVTVQFGGVGNHDDDDPPGEEMELRERSTSMSVKSSFNTPTYSRRLISKMTKEERQSICETADLIRKTEGFRTYNTESEQESEGEEPHKEIILHPPDCGCMVHQKNVKFKTCEECGKEYSDTGGVKDTCTCIHCRNCGRPAKVCLCVKGIIPDWQREICVACSMARKHCKCEKFIEHLDGMFLEGHPDYQNWTGISRVTKSEG